jgi:hypothetical protein
MESWAKTELLPSCRDQNSIHSEVELGVPLLYSDHLLIVFHFDDFDERDARVYIDAFLLELFLNLCMSVEENEHLEYKAWKDEQTHSHTQKYACAQHHTSSMAEASGSSRGSMRSPRWNSVTRDPKRAKACASSHPIGPAPITAMLGGSVVRFQTFRFVR